MEKKKNRYTPLIPRRIHALCYISMEDIEYWIERLLWQGYVPKEISKYLGIPHVTVYQWMDKLGIDYRYELRWRKR